MVARRMPTNPTVQLNSEPTRKAPARPMAKGVSCGLAGTIFREEQGDGYDDDKRPDLAELGGQIGIGPLADRGGDLLHLGSALVGLFHLLDQHAGIEPARQWPRQECRTARLARWACTCSVLRIGSKGCQACSTTAPATAFTWPIASAATAGSLAIVHTAPARKPIAAKARSHVGMRLEFRPPGFPPGPLGFLCFFIVIFSPPKFG